MKNMKALLAANIRKLRGNKFTQEEVAALSGLSKRAYVSIELGESWPQMSNIQALAKLFGVSEVDLFQDPERIPTPEEALEVIRKAIMIRT